MWLIVSISSSNADETTFFSKNLKMKHAMELATTTDYFSSYSGLNSDISYGEIAGIGALTGVHVAACGLKSFDVISDTRCKN